MTTQVRHMRSATMVVSVKWWKKADVTSGHLPCPLVAKRLVSSRSPRTSTHTDALYATIKERLRVNIVSLTQCE